MRILAVDDDELALEVLATALGCLGYSNVTTASSARDACRIIAAAEAPFDCLLIDIEMPGRIGIDLCRRLRTLPAYAAVPILMVTALTDRRYVEAAFEAGATDYLTKPFEVLDLGARVRMAERLAQTISEANENARVVRALRHEIEEAPPAAFSVPVSLEGDDRILDLPRLEQNLLRVSRGHLTAVNIFAVQLREAESLYARYTPTDFRRLLTAVAATITAALQPNTFFLSYAGSGAFACALYGRAVEHYEELETTTNASLGGMAPADSRGMVPELSLHFGQPIRLGMLHGGLAAIDALHAALEAIQHDCPSVVAPEADWRAPGLQSLAG